MATKGYFYCGNRNFILMDYFKLIFGIILITVYAWSLIGQIKRAPISRSWLHIDLIVGMILGFGIVITSTISILT